MKPVMTTYDCGSAGTVELPLYYITRTEDLEHLDQWLSGLKRRVLIDTETSGLDYWKDRVATYQFGLPAGPDARLYVVDVRCVDFSALQALLRKHLTRRGLKKLGMNIGFECRFTMTGFGVPIRDVEDIQLSEQVLRTGLLGGSDAGSTENDGEHSSRKSRSAYKHTSMRALASFYLGIEIDKDQALRTSFDKTAPGQHNERQLAYAAGDCVYPYFIAKYQDQELRNRDLKATAELEWEVIPVLAEAQLRGFYIDQVAWRVLWQEAVAKLDETQRALDRLFLAHQGDLFGNTNSDVRPLYLGGKRPVPLNYGSPDHLRWFITQYCKQVNWPVRIVTDLEELKALKAQHGRQWLERQAERGRRVSESDIPDWVLPEDQYCILLDTERDTLIVAKCLKQLPANIVDLLCDYSNYRKRSTTYGADFLRKNVKPHTGRIHTEFHQCVTNTGRISTEPNSQNWPGDKRYRACAKAAPGKKYAIADLSQVEPRITALVSGDPTYRNTYLTGDDLYLAVAHAVLGERPDKHTPEGALQRQRFKQMVLSLAYRMGKQKFRRKMILALHKEIMAGTAEVPTFQEISDLYDRFFEAHPKIKEYQERTAQDAFPFHYDDKGNKVENPRRIWDAWLQAPVTWVEAPCGRKRFFGPDANPYSEAPNVPPQAGSASMLKAAMGLIQREIDRHGWTERAGLVNTIHDELVYEVDEEIASEFALILKAKMEEAGNYYNGDIPIIAEFPENSNGVVDIWTKKVELEELAA